MEHVAAAGAVVCTFSSHGCGSSYMPAGPFWRALSTARAAEDALALLDALGWNRDVALYSWSYGAQVGLELAARAPERVSSCTFVGVTPTGFEMFLALTLGAPLNFLATMVGGLWRRAKAWAALHRFFTPEWLRAPAPGGDGESRMARLLRLSAECERKNNTMDAAMSGRAARAQEWAATTFRLTAAHAAAIRGARVPITLVNGARDFTAPLGGAVRLARRLGAPLLVLDARHAGLGVERCEELLEVLERAVFGACVSTPAARAAARAAGEAAIMRSSFCF